MDTNAIFSILRQAQTKGDRKLEIQKHTFIDPPFSRIHEMACVFAAGVLWFLSLIILGSLMV